MAVRCRDRHSGLLPTEHWLPCSGRSRPSCSGQVPSVGTAAASRQAAIAQLGERQTEDLKVPGSIPGLGMLFAPLERASPFARKVAFWHCVASLLVMPQAAYPTHFAQSPRCDQSPATRNRTRDHLIAANFYSQMLYQLSYSRLVAWCGQAGLDDQPPCKALSGVALCCGNRRAPARPERPWTARGVSASLA